MEQEPEVQPQLMRLDNHPLVDDIAGESKAFVESFIEATETEGIYKTMGVDPDKTFALFGPPGVGKTLAIHAIHNTMNRELFEKVQKKAKGGETSQDLAIEDFSLLTFPYDIGKFGTAYINMGSRNIQSFFDKVGMYSQFGLKTLVVLDEADALLASRTSGSRSHAEDKKSLETIMKNLQEAHDADNMYVAIISNLPEACDPASLRAGRIDRTFTFKLPDYNDRKKGFEVAMNRINERAGYQIIRSFSYDNLAELSEGMSYADIVSATERAVKTRAREVAHEKGIIRAPYIKGKRLEEAVKAHRADRVKDEKVIGFNN